MSARRDRVSIVVHRVASPPPPSIKLCHGSSVNSRLDCDVSLYIQYIHIFDTKAALYEYFNQSQNITQIYFDVAAQGQQQQRAEATTTSRTSSIAAAAIANDDDATAGR